MSSGLPRPVGYVLGGGGSLGAIQVGMLQTLGEHHVAPDLLAASRSGSLNGAVVVLDPKGAASRLSHSRPVQLVVAHITVPIDHRC